MPTDNAASMRFDPMQLQENPVLLALNMSTAVDINAEAVELLIMFAGKYGLTGCAIEYPSENCFPLGEPKEPKTYENRSEEYNCIFSPLYAETASGFATWLVGLNRRFSGEINKPLIAVPSARSLRSMVESVLEDMLLHRNVHRCIYCGKFYYDEDPDSVFCEESCAFQHRLNGSIADTMKSFKGHLIGGG
jgi:hypothetical protein